MIYAKNNPIPQNHNRYEQQFEYMFVFSKGKPNTFNPLKENTKTKGKEYSWKNTNDYGDKSAKRSRDEISIGKDTKNRFNIWFMSVASSKFTNSAPFPEKLAEDHILSWSNPDDVVMDCLAGSGTTGIMAHKNGRKFILIETSETYCDIIKERFKIRFNLDIKICH